jgi:hypothetical protein
MTAGVSCRSPVPLARSGPEGERDQPCEARDQDGGQGLLA